MVQIMVCRLLDAKSLSEPMLIYCYYEHSEQISVKFEWEFWHFHSRKSIWKCLSAKWRPFSLGSQWVNTSMAAFGHIVLCNEWSKYTFTIPYFLLPMNFVFDSRPIYGIYMYFLFYMYLYINYNKRLSVVVWHCLFFFTVNTLRASDTYMHQ